MEETTPRAVSIEFARSGLVRELRGLPGVTMIGIGERDGEPCLRVYVVEISALVKQRIPTTHLGWPVDLEESGELRAR